MAGRVYDTQRWHRCRRIKMSRNPICEGCEERPTEHVDHIVPTSKGGSIWQSSNWMSLCLRCHNSKTAADRKGVPWVPPKHRGCDVDGAPRRPWAGQS